MQPSGFGPLMYSSRQGAQRRSSAMRRTVAARWRHPVYPQCVRLLPRRGPRIEKLQQDGDVEGLRAALVYDNSSASDDGAVWTLPASSRAEAAAALATF